MATKEEQDELNVSRLFEELRELRKWSQWQTALLAAIAALLGARLAIPTM